MEDGEHYLIRIGSDYNESSSNDTSLTWSLEYLGPISGCMDSGV